MKKKLFIIFCFLILSISVFAQENTSSAPIKWQDYKISAEKVKIKFPKLPVRLDTSDYCNEIAVKHFYAYADEVVYELKIFEKVEAPDFCLRKEKFSEKSFTKNLLTFESESGYASKQNIERGNYRFVKFEKSDESHRFLKWFLNDFKNSRWFEFTISTYKEKNVDENFFVDSFGFEIDEKDIEINNGADVLLGDEMPAEKSSEITAIAPSENKEEIVVPFRLITQPKPKYTSEARKANILGNVKIKVVFLNNGAIGNVKPSSDFDLGLIGQSIIAAKKMAFLPKKVNGKKYTIVKTVVYNFTLY